MGKNGGFAIAYGISLGHCLVQNLSLKAVTFNNDDLELLADALETYPYLLELDLSQNRIEGAHGGQSLARIIMRRMDK